VSDQPSPAAQSAADYRETFVHAKSGQRVLRDLMGRFSVISGMQSTDAHGLAILEGQRQVVLHIIHHALEPTSRDKIADWAQAQLDQLGYDYMPGRPLRKGERSSLEQFGLESAPDGE